MSAYSTASASTPSRPSASTASEPAPDEALVFSTKPVDGDGVAEAAALVAVNDCADEETALPDADELALAPAMLDVGVTAAEAEAPEEARVVALGLLAFAALQ